MMTPYTLLVTMFKNTEEMERHVLNRIKRAMKINTTHTFFILWRIKCYGGVFDLFFRTIWELTTYTVLSIGPPFHDDATHTHY